MHVYGTVDAGHDLIGPPRETAAREGGQSALACARRCEDGKSILIVAGLLLVRCAPAHDVVAISAGYDSSESVYSAPGCCFLKAVQNDECMLAAGIAIAPRELQF